MEDYQSRKPPTQRYRVSHNLAHQLPPLSDADHEPLDEEQTVVPLSGPSRLVQMASGSLDSIAETPLTPRSLDKRKKTAHGKPRSTAHPGATSPQAANSQPFAEELQRLEDLAERINHILAERARQSARSEPPPPQQATTDPDLDGAVCPSPQPRSPISVPDATSALPPQPPLEAADTEHLRQQAQRIRHRLAQLEGLMDAANSGAAAPWDAAAIVDSAPPSPPGTHPPPPSIPARPRRVGYPPPTPSNSNPPNPFDPVRQRGEYESWRAAEELRRLRAQEHPFYEPRDRHLEGHQGPRDRPTRPPNVDSSIREQAFVRIQRFPLSRWLGLPGQAADRLSDAVIWMVAAAIARIAARYLVASVPMLSPIVSAIMLAPAVLAIVLALFVPRTGWLLFYRLFLIMVGLFIGGKAF